MLGLHKLSCSCILWPAHADSGVHDGMQVRSLMAQLMDGLQYLHSQVGNASDSAQQSLRYSQHLGRRILTSKPVTACAQDATCLPTGTWPGAVWQSSTCSAAPLHTQNWMRGR
jgi:hypothetical protein